VVPAVWTLVPLSVLGGTGNGYANVCASTLLVTRTPDAERGRVSAAANAAVGGAQGVSLLAGGAVAAVLSPREIYATAGLLGVAVATALAVFYAAGATRTGQHVLPRSRRTAQQLTWAAPPPRDPPRPQAVAVEPSCRDSRPRGAVAPSDDRRPRSQNPDCGI